MRTKSVLLTAAFACGTALVAACSGNGLSGSQSTLPGGNSAQTKFRMAERTGVAPAFLRNLHFGTVSPDAKKKKKKKALKELAVSDFGTGAVEILNNKYVYQSSITSGLNGPDGDFIDAKDNLYVANYAGLDVAEYNKTGSQTHTYSSGLTDPVGVTTDVHGNVFVADYGSGQASVVVEYAQGSTTPTTSCSTGLANEGVAVDKAGDVFVSGNNPNTGQGNLVEFTGGLSGCSGTTLGVTLGFAGGLQLDNKKDLVACDQNVGVDIIPPPYSSVGSTITGTLDAFHVALDAKNKLVFIADPSSLAVFVDNYPSGSSVATLGSANGLSDPAGVATWPYLP